MVIGIIGAGASGMAAALASAENPDVQVILLERQARVGRKLSATGNGRCNLTNLHANKDSYHGDDPAFAAAAIARFPVQETLNWFSDLELYTVAEDSGRVYPYSDQANSVVDVLRFALEKKNGITRSEKAVMLTAFSIFVRSLSYLCCYTKTDSRQYVYLSRFLFAAAAN